MRERGGTIAGFYGWSPEDLAANTGASLEQTRRLLYDAVRRGEIALLVCGPTRLYARLEAPIAAAPNDHRR